MLTQLNWILTSIRVRISTDAYVAQLGFDYLFMYLKLISYMKCIKTIKETVKLQTMEENL